MDDEARPTSSRGRGGPSPRGPRRTGRTRREAASSISNNRTSEGTTRERSQNNTPRTPARPRAIAASTSTAARARSSASPPRRERTPLFTPRSAGSARNVARPSPPPAESSLPEPIYSEAEDNEFPDRLFVYDFTAANPKSKTMADEKISRWISPTKRERQRRERKEREMREARRRKRRPPAPNQEVLDENGVPFPPTKPALRPSTEVIELSSSDDDQPTSTRSPPRKAKRPNSKNPPPPESVIELVGTTTEEDDGPTNDEEFPTRKRKRPFHKKPLPPRKRARAESVDELRMRNADEAGGGGGRSGTLPPLTDGEELTGTGIDIGMDELDGDQPYDDLNPFVNDRTEDREAKMDGQRDTLLAAENSNPTIIQVQDWFDPETETLAHRLEDSRLFDEALALVAKEPNIKFTPARGTTASTEPSTTDSPVPVLDLGMSSPLPTDTTSLSLVPDPAVSAPPPTGTSSRVRRPSVPSPPCSSPNGPPQTHHASTLTFPQAIATTSLSATAPSVPPAPSAVSPPAPYASASAPPRLNSRISIQYTMQVDRKIAAMKKVKALRRASGTIAVVGAANALSPLIVTSMAPPHPPPPPQAKPPDTVPVPNSQVPDGYTPPLSPRSDSTLGGSPPVLFVAPGVDLPPIDISLVKQVEETADSEDDGFESAQLLYP